jgi:hypothetical protein
MRVFFICNHLYGKALFTWLILLMYVSVRKYLHVRKTYPIF